MRRDDSPQTPLPYIAPVKHPTKINTNVSHGERERERARASQDVRDGAPGVRVEQSRAEIEWNQS